jgi:hypothetical protein
MTIDIVETRRKSHALGADIPPTTTLQLWLAIQDDNLQLPALPPVAQERVSMQTKIIDDFVAIACLSTYIQFVLDMPFG